MTNSGILIFSLIVLIVGILFLYFKTYIFNQIINDNSIPIIVWWTQLMPDAIRSIECDQFNCLVTNNRSYRHSNNLHAFLFYGSRIENNDFPLPRESNVSWAILHEESPKNYAPILFVEAQSLFNVSATFSRFSDFPVTLQYLNNLNSLTDTKYFTDLKVKNEFLDSNAPVLYIQSDCDTPIGRDYLVKELMNYIEIDSYGKCLNNKIFPKKLRDIFSLDLYNENYMKFIGQYKFIISFENAICDDYITEKLWRPLIAGSIPIYYGSPTIEDWLPNDNSAILVKDFRDMKTLADFINIVNKNDTLYETFLRHKLLRKIDNERLKNGHTFEEDNNVISEFECFVCKSIHYNRIYPPKSRNVYNCLRPMSIGGNTWHQHWDVGKCQARALKQLIKDGRQYSSSTFDKTWQRCLKNDEEEN